MARSPGETTEWVAGILRKKGLTKEVAVLGPQIIRITRCSQLTRCFAPFNAGIISATEVTPTEIRPFLDSNTEVEIITNVPRELLWTGSAIELASAHSIAFGGIGDLMSAVSNDDVRQYVKSEYKFVERGLLQHDKVSHLVREYDRVYVVHRVRLSPLRFVMLNEYELTGDHVRAFDAILLNNPNGSATLGAKEIAKSLGVNIFKWGQFLGRLNSK